MGLCSAEPRQELLLPVLHHIAHGGSQRLLGASTVLPAAGGSQQAEFAFRFQVQYRVLQLFLVEGVSVLVRVLDVVVGEDVFELSGGQVLDC